MTYIVVNSLNVQDETYGVFKMYNIIYTIMIRTN